MSLTFDSVMEWSNAHFACITLGVSILYEARPTVSESIGSASFLEISADAAVVGNFDEALIPSFTVMSDPAGGGTLSHNLKTCSTSESCSSALIEAKAMNFDCLDVFRLVAVIHG